MQLAPGRLCSGTEPGFKRVIVMVKLSVIRGQRSQANPFESLLRPHYDMLYRLAFYWTRSAEDAEDLVQDVCVRALPRLAELESLDKPESWLTRVMYRRFIDLTRRHERRRVEPLDDAKLSVLCADTPTPDESAERDELSARLDRAWQRIDREKRTLVAMHDLEGYTLAELTEMTGIKEGTLKSRLHRTRAQLGRMLEAEAPAADVRNRTGGFQ